MRLYDLKKGDKFKFYNDGDTYVVTSESVDCSPAETINIKTFRIFAHDRDSQVIPMLFDVHLEKVKEGEFFIYNDRTYVKVSTYTAVQIIPVHDSKISLSASTVVSKIGRHFLGDFQQ